MLCPTYHVTEPFLLKQRLHCACKMSARFTLSCSVHQKICHLRELHLGFVVTCFRIAQIQIADQDDLLPVVVKGDDLVKKHQIHVLKVFRILYFCFHRRFGIGQIVIGKISDQSSGERWQILHFRTAVILQDLPDVGRRVVRMKMQRTRLKLSVHTGDLHFRIVSEKCIPPPFGPVLHGFQHITVVGYVFKDLHHFDWRSDICKDLTADRCYTVPSAFGDLPDFLQAGSELHLCLLLLFVEGQ